MQNVFLKNIYPLWNVSIFLRRIFGEFNYQFMNFIQFKNKHRLTFFILETLKRKILGVLFFKFTYLFYIKTFQYIAQQFVNS